VRPGPRLAWLTVYAIAMALVEAAIVVHLRHAYYPENPLALFRWFSSTRTISRLKLAREFATLVMMLVVALLAARGFVRRFAAFVYVFGLWISSTTSG